MVKITSSESRKGRLPGEAGTVITEFSIALPLLVFLILAMVDFGALICNYMLFEQAAREGVRSAGRLPGLEASTYNSPNDAATVVDINNCTLTPGAPFCEHVLIHARVRNVLRQQNTWNVALAGVAVNSTYQPLPLSPAVPGPEDDSVLVEINGMYQGWLRRYTMNVSLRGPYLFQRAT